MNEVNPVAAVCGSEVRIYGSVDEKTKRRPLMKIIECGNRGKAVMYAQDHDDTEKARQVKHSRSH